MESAHYNLKFAGISDAGHATRVRVVLRGSRGEITVDVDRVNRTAGTVHCWDDYAQLRGASRQSVERAARRIAQAAATEMLPVVTMNESLTICGPC